MPRAPLPTAAAPAVRAGRGRGGAAHRDAHRARLSAVLAGFVLAAGMSGCTPAEDADGPPEPAASVRSTAPATPTETPTAAPALVPGGTAADNLPFFRSVIAGVWASPDSVRGFAYVDALAGAGFDRSAMQLTADTTTIGEPAESIQVAVAWTDGCLVGQVGPATGDPVAAVLPLLSGGRCLVGDTVSVDG